MSQNAVGGTHLSFSPIGRRSSGHQLRDAYQISSSCNCRRCFQPAQFTVSMAKFGFLFSIFTLALHHHFLPGVMSTTFTILNQCDYTNGESQAVSPPASWGGRFWGRTLCATDNSTGKFTCQTGDCGSGKVECAGGGAAPPATLAEFKLDGDGGLDFYDVSLVDGYNIPMLVVPEGGSGANCTSTGCVVDLNSACPSDLRVLSDDSGETVACKSACDAFNQPQYCCSGSYSSPDTCKPSSYSELFKKACPRAYSYAYDDKSSTFTCGGSANYAITFCPSPSTSQKASEGQTSPASGTPSMNSSMVYVGVLEASSSPSTSINVLGSHAFAGSVAIVAAILRLWQLC
ncbi:hypothetical protein Nepgr_005113 [Nepenthes gracilis]|uniref:Thaumatin-like protein 1b n=1 Tax=Nepenthes gracilis TaxID=150966 RepID=A0AAD3S2J8_NEPGR|nr:hypothetical protein Nepgr_005113 [Nepenthes gracilis]